MPTPFAKLLASSLLAAIATFTPANAGDGHTDAGGSGHDHGAVEDDNGHGPAHKSRHGGRIVESGHHHLEIVVKDGRLQLYVVDPAGEPEDVTGAKASAAILSEGRKVDIVLSPESGALTGSGDFKAKPNAVIVVTLTMPGHEPEQARIKLD